MKTVPKHPKFKGMLEAMAEARVEVVVCMEEVVVRVVEDGVVQGRGRSVCGKGRGRSTISTTPSFLQHTPDEAVSIETMDVGFMERDNFQPSRDTGPHLPEGGYLTELDIFNLFFTNGDG